MQERIIGYDGTLSSTIQYQLIYPKYMTNISIKQASSIVTFYFVAMEKINMQTCRPRNHGHTTSIKMNLTNTDQITKDNASMQTCNTSVPTNLISND